MEFFLALIRNILMLVLLISVFTITGCESMSSKFTPQDKVNLTPFATNTAAMVNTIDYGLERDTALHTRVYFKQADELAEMREVYELQDQLVKILRGIVAYSVKIVSLSKSDKTESEKAFALAEYLDGLEKHILGYYIDKEIITEEDYEEALGKIESQQEFLAALATAQPFIDYVAAYSGILVDRLVKLEMKVEVKMQEAIDEDHRAIIDFYRMLLNRRDSVMTGLQMIDQHYQGDTNALKQMERSGMLAKLGFKSNKINTANVEEIESRLFEKFSELQKRFEELQPDYDIYLEIHRELDRLIRVHNEEVRQSMDVIMLWTEAHRKMASGITEPAEWFDITDPGGNFFDLTKTVIEKAL